MFPAPQHSTTVIPRCSTNPPAARTSSMPPASVRPPGIAPALIRAQQCCASPVIVQVEFIGRISLADIRASRDFGNVVKALEGKPFRVLCDFTQAVTMPLEVCAVFVRGQAFAVARGMERDAFVCSSSVLRLQFARIARESGRYGSLGPLRFFDTLEQGRTYLTR